MGNQCLRMIVHMAYQRCTKQQIIDQYRIQVLDKNEDKDYVLHHLEMARRLN